MITINNLEGGEIEPITINPDTIVCMYDVGGGVRIRYVNPENPSGPYASAIISYLEEDAVRAAWTVG